MKKWIKTIIRIIVGIILLFIIDLLCIFVIDRPLLAKKKDNGDLVNKVYKGLLYDVYNCHEYPTPQIKIKGNKFNCSELIKSYQLNNSSKIYDLNSYIKLDKDKTTFVINNISRKNIEEKVIIKNIEVKLYLNEKLLTEYKNNNKIDMIVPDDESTNEREFLVELDKTLNNISIEYKSDLKYDEYKNNYIYLDIAYKTKDNLMESERIKLFFA